MSVLERLLTLARKGRPGCRIRIEVVDPDCKGCGLHKTDQPDYLLLNTTCGQVSMFPDRFTVGDEACDPGPSLYEWVTARGLKIAEDGFSVGSTGREIHPHDFLPRRMLGEYLDWFLRPLEGGVPDHVELSKRPTTVVDIVSGADDRRCLTLADGSQLTVDYVFLTLGHLANDGGDLRRPEASRLVHPPFPLPEQVARIRPGESVAITGFGLTAMDLISTLTRGRGGRYVERTGKLRYEPSGDEPTIFLLSRSGVPFRARPQICRFDHEHRPLMFTEENVDALRSARGGRLDFDRDVLPLILTEMRIVYRECQARQAGVEEERDLSNRLSAGDVERALDELDHDLGVFDPMTALDGAIGMRLDDGAAYQQWLVDSIARDLAEAALGTSRSPVKAALDVFRQCRDTVRYAVDFKGLTDSSLEEFYRRTIPLMNRAVVGPQFERHQELIALVEAGVLEAPLGPSPAISWEAGSGGWILTSTALAQPCSRRADWLCPASVPLPNVESSASPLIQALQRRGRIRPFLPNSRLVTGADVTPDLHLVDAKGEPDRRIWVLGPLCEGAIFYNHLVPSPRVWSRPIADAHRCVKAMYVAAGCHPAAAARSS
jgi:uncharacterized NAD(P)/FAD-binding protein YdhS